MLEYTVQTGIGNREKKPPYLCQGSELPASQPAPATLRADSWLANPADILSLWLEIAILDLLLPLLLPQLYRSYVYVRQATPRNSGYS